MRLQNFSFASYAACFMISFMLSHTQALAQGPLSLSPFTFDLPFGLTAGNSENQSTVVITDPQRVQDPRAAVIILSHVPVQETMTKEAALLILRKADVLDADEPDETFELAPIPSKAGVDIPLMVHRWNKPYRIHIWGAASVPNGVFFVRVHAKSEADYRLYMAYLRNILSTLTFRR